MHGTINLKLNGVVGLHIFLNLVIFFRYLISLIVSANVVFFIWKS
jgi:hypothetical protein